MKIHLECTHCGKKLATQADQPGKRARCPACREIMVVPWADALTPPPPAAMPCARDEWSSSPLKRPPQGPLIATHVEPTDHELIDMTAMVDIVFFLLIFFMVTSMHAMQASISLPTPEAQPDSRGAARVAAPNEDQVVVQVDADDTIAVDGEDVASRQELIARLREAERDNLLVLASGDAMHGTVVMVLDAGSDAGMEQIRLVSEGLEDD